MARGVDQVKQNIGSIYGRRIAALVALTMLYKQMAIEEFRREQPPKPNSAGRFWHNKTGQAAARMHTDAFNESDKIIGWRMAHGVIYGVDLELANNGSRQAIRPIIQRYAGRFFKDARKVFGG